MIINLKYLNGRTRIKEVPDQVDEKGEFVLHELDSELHDLISKTPKDKQAELMKQSGGGKLFKREKHNRFLYIEQNK